MDLNENKIKCYACGEYGHERDSCIRKIDRRAHMLNKKERKMLEEKPVVGDIPTYAEMRI
jgi:hypothetical protein